MKVISIILPPSAEKIVARRLSLKKTLFLFILLPMAVCGKSKEDMAVELGKASTKALNAYAQAIEENSTDCDKMGNALQKPVQDFVAINIKLKKIGIELKKNNEKVKLTKEVISARDRLTAASRIMIKCADHPKVMKANKALLDGAN